MPYCAKLYFVPSSEKPRSLNSATSPAKRKKAVHKMQILARKNFFAILSCIVFIRTSQKCYYSFYRLFLYFTLLKCKLGVCYLHDTAFKKSSIAYIFLYKRPPFCPFTRFI